MPPQYQSDIFVIMPFADEFTPIYEDHLTSVANSLGYSIKRGDNFFSKRSIMADVWSAIVNSKLVIADCTGRNPNVFYELGIAHTLDKPVIMITQNMDDIPFDVRHLRAISYEYTPRGMSDLEKSLMEAFDLILDEEAYIENIKNNPSDLPANSDDQLKIVEAIIEQGDFDAFERLLPFLKGVKVGITKKLIEMNDLPHASDVIQTLKGSGSLKSVGVALYDAGYADTPLMQDVITNIVNHTEKRALARHIFEQHGENSDVFRSIVNSFTNGAELRNLGIYFLNDDRVDSPAFDHIVKHLENQRKPAELKNLAIEFINRDMTDRTQFRRIMTALESYPSRADEVLAYLEHNAGDSPKKREPLDLQIEDAELRNISPGIRDQVFISYSHEDRRWLGKLTKMLRPLIRQDMIKVWSDEQITPGSKWKDEIKQALATAKVAILLVTPDFLASEFIATNELPWLLKAAEEEGLIILWVAISPSMYRQTVIAEFQAVNDPSRPLSGFRSSADQNGELVKICEQIWTAFND